MTCLASAVKPLDEGRSVFVCLAASQTVSLRAERACPLVAAGEGASGPATYALTYTQPFGCARLRTAYEATKVLPLRILPNGSLPERSTPPLRELQPYLYPAAFEEASRAQGEHRTPTLREGTFGRVRWLTLGGVLALTSTAGHDMCFNLSASLCFD